MIPSSSRTAPPFIALPLLGLTLLMAALGGCASGQSGPTGAGGRSDAGSASGRKTLTLAAFTVSKEAYQEAIIPAFQAYWKKKTGQDVEFQQSYEASGTLARNIVNGLEADVAALSLEGDMNKLVKAGLMGGDWKNGPHRGMVADSAVVIAARKGNPKGIRDWADLTRPGVELLMPNPRISGGAKWNVLAIYGAGLGPNRDEAGALALLRDIKANILSMDKSGRESFSAFEHGLGDAAITYENEILRARQDGRDYDLILPSATILIENPAATVTRNADKHGVREIADAFVTFLLSDEAQRAFARNHFRPVKPEVAQEFAERYPRPARLFTVEDLGGWKRVEETVFGPGGAWDRVMQPGG